jgi:hypothetical protein
MQGGEAGEWGYGGQMGQGPPIGGVFERVLVIAGTQAGGGGLRVLVGGSVGGGGLGEIAGASRAVRRLATKRIGFFADRASGQDGG